MTKLVSFLLLVGILFNVLGIRADSFVAGQSGNSMLVESCPHEEESSEQTVVQVRICNCSVALMPTIVLVTAVLSLLPGLFEGVRLVKTAVLLPPTPPPRFV